jgi:hypothetical protein
MNNAMATALHQQILKERMCRSMSNRFVTQPTHVSGCQGQVFPIPTHDYLPPRRSTSAAGVGQWLHDKRYVANVYHKGEHLTISAPGFDGYHGYVNVSGDGAGDTQTTAEGFETVAGSYYSPSPSALTDAAAQQPFSRPKYAPSTTSHGDARTEWSARCRAREAAANAQAHANARVVAVAGTAILRPDVRAV